MKISETRKRFWILVLTAGLTCAVLPADMPAQQRWGEVGLGWRRFIRRDLDP